MTEPPPAGSDAPGSSEEKPTGDSAAGTTTSAHEGSDAPTPAEEEPTTAPTVVRTTFTPPDPSWIRPRLAVIVVSVVAVAILIILFLAVWELSIGPGTPASPGVAAVAPTPDPNAGTIAALAGAAFTALASLIAAYFGVKVASEAAAQSAATTTQALQALADSTTNGNPRLRDF